VTCETRETREMPGGVYNGIDFREVMGAWLVAILENPSVVLAGSSERATFEDRCWLGSGILRYSWDM
jgi:hypothetical protein